MTTSLFVASNALHPKGECWPGHHLMPLCIRGNLRSQGQAGLESSISYLHWLSPRYSFFSLEAESDGLMGDGGEPLHWCSQCDQATHTKSSCLWYPTHTQTCPLSERLLCFHQMTNSMSEDSFQSCAHFLKMYYLHYHLQKWNTYKSNKICLRSILRKTTKLMNKIERTK